MTKVGLPDAHEGLHKEDPTSMARLYALGGQMRLVASRAVVEAAAGVADEILETYPVPNRNLEELRDLARRGVVKNLLTDFSEACRADLAARVM